MHGAAAVVVLATAVFTATVAADALPKLPAGTVAPPPPADPAHFAPAASPTGPSLDTPTPTTTSDRSLTPKPTPILQTSGQTGRAQAAAHFTLQSFGAGTLSQI